MIKVVLYIRLNLWKPAVSRYAYL